MNTESGAPAPVAVQEAPQPSIEMNRPPLNLQPATEFLAPGESTALATLEQVANNPQSVNNIETALTLWSTEEPSAQVEQIAEAEYTIDDTPGYQPEANTAPPIVLQEPAVPTPPQAEQQPDINPQLASQQIDADIARRGADAANAYDQLVYQYPDRAQQLADAGNERAKAALNRRDELAKNPSTSTAIEVRASDQNVQRTELPGQERKQLTTEAGTGTELSRQVREVQTVLEQVTTVLERVDTNEEIPAEIKEVTFRMADAVKLLLLLLINSMDLDFYTKQAAMRTIAGEKEPAKKTKTERVVVTTSVIGGGERPKLEDKGTETVAPEVVPVERQLMLPGPTEPATPLEGPILDAARLLPGPVENAPAERPVPQLTDNSNGVIDINPRAVEPVPVPVSTT